MKRVQFTDTRWEVETQDILSLDISKYSPRKSCFKQSSIMPTLPPRAQYSHFDPLIRRLRLTNASGTRLSLLSNITASTQLVLFLFASTHSPNLDLLSQFAASHLDTMAVIFVSLDSSKEGYQSVMDNGPAFLGCDWDDGTVKNEGDDEQTDHSRREAFLPPAIPDLEASLHLNTDPEGLLYTRPYTRARLAEMFGVIPEGIYDHSFNLPSDQLFTPPPSSDTSKIASVVPWFIGSLPPEFGKKRPLNKLLTPLGGIPLASSLEQWEERFSVWSIGQRLPSHSLTHTLSHTLTHTVKNGLGGYAVMALGMGVSYMLAVRYADEMEFMDEAVSTMSAGSGVEEAVMKWGEHALTGLATLGGGLWSAMGF